MFFPSLPKEKERGSKGRAIYRAVGSQVTYATLCGPAAYAPRHLSNNNVYNLYSYRHWRHLQKGKKVKSTKEKYISQQVLRAVIADISGIINITDIADIATDIADIAVETGRRVQGVTRVSCDKV
jgi:hypothetical protein